MTRYRVPGVATILLALAAAAPLAAQDQEEPPRCALCDRLAELLRSQAQEWARQAGESLRQSGAHERFLECFGQLYQAIPEEWLRAAFRLFVDLYLQLPRQWRREIYRALLQNMRNLPPDFRRDLQRELLRAMMGDQGWLPSFLR